ncbi:global transactivator [Fusarium subglutinans]|uniref:Global transactivator n=1 Tax=Gibberella subglutinans TaxID=42677 RepID=A0A8H5QBJ9_GIBSU|nr:global transactivator [Fusarium subglutinans]KAF5610988.1 global transactivator [Fusarium subglutinans]
MQFANVVIRCGQWWKKAWEQQAAGRVHRPGQQKPTLSTNSEPRTLPWGITRWRTKDGNGKISGYFVLREA